MRRISGYHLSKTLFAAKDSSRNVGTRRIDLVFDVCVEGVGVVNDVIEPEVGDVLIWRDDQDVV